MLTVVRHWDNLYFQFRHGTLDGEMWDIYERTLLHWLAHPAWYAWFCANAENCSVSLQKLVRQRFAGRATGACETT